MTGSSSPRSGGASIVVHGHFYQPPREDPWFGEVEAEPTAAPFHDWNERINQECYRPVTAARILGAGGRIARIMNTLTAISYNTGPTLLDWMEREAPDTYAAFLEADRESRSRLGFGNAMAMPYHHVILPLCSRRDKLTEVRWGMKDFRRRFGREPDGMWLPEAAVDHETLGVLASCGIRFTVIGPSQVDKVPKGGLPGRYRATGGLISIFVYDGPLSHDVAFGPLLENAGRWTERMLEEGRSSQLVSLATDGETWGHHHKFGEMALAATLDQLGRRREVRVENFASFLARNPPVEDVVIVSPSSWSCPHGVERWRRECGCKTAPQIPTQQQWRTPLRSAIDWLAGELHEVFEREGGLALKDPWEARDAFGAVSSGDEAAVDLRLRARELLEMERNALAMFTSCAWFFDDVGDVATFVVLRHAARALELAGDERERLEAGFLQRLSTATSNDPAVGDASRMYRERVVPKFPPPTRAAAGFATAQLVAPEKDAQLNGYLLTAPLGPLPTEEGDRSWRLVVEVEDRRTGERNAASISVARLSAGRVAVTVLESRREASFNDLPERHRVIVRRALVRSIADARFGPAQIEALKSDGRDLRRVTLDALSDAAGALATDGSENATARLEDLLDLADLLGLPSIPVEAQTRFYRAWSSADGDLRTRLSRLAPRFGFVEQ